MKFNLALTLLAASASSAAAWTLRGFKDSTCTTPNDWVLSGAEPQDCYALDVWPRAINVAGLPNDIEFSSYSDANCETNQTSGGNNCYAPSKGPIVAFKLTQRSAN
ncbi:uncharacterized protein N7496_006938 [Penicillium cataractarum]|uniref:Uncharacterized protein n=1 Tax=Penicillium cataractarum TaxID=2100454 RepID=A0A9W9S2K1_9EURO|nr:uncharacterized protein N7496_006938 [Penicillium cataractarum]KAJ5370846.1 hypothetical protein N7496_006938 [Penicillium cataractarum]